MINTYHLRQKLLFFILFLSLFSNGVFSSYSYPPEVFNAFSDVWDNNDYSYAWGFEILAVINNFRAVANQALVVSMTGVPTSWPDTLEWWDGTTYAPKVPLVPSDYLLECAALEPASSADFASSCSHASLFETIEVIQATVATLQWGSDDNDAIDLFVASQYSNLEAFIYNDDLAFAGFYVSQDGTSSKITFIAATSAVLSEFVDPKLQKAPICFPICRDSTDCEWAVTHHSDAPSPTVHQGSTTESDMTVTRSTFDPYTAGVIHDVSDSSLRGYVEFSSEYRSPMYGQMQGAYLLSSPASQVFVPGCSSLGSPTDSSTCIRSSCYLQTTDGACVSTSGTDIIDDTVTTPELSGSFVWPTSNLRSNDIEMTFSYPDAIISMITDELVNTRVKGISPSSTTRPTSGSVVIVFNATTNTELLCAATTDEVDIPVTIEGVNSFSTVHVTGYGNGETEAYHCDGSITPYASRDAHSLLYMINAHRLNPQQFAVKHLTITTPLSPPGDLSSSSKPFFYPSKALLRTAQQLADEVHEAGSVSPSFGDKLNYFDYLFNGFNGSATFEMFSGTARSDVVQAAFSVASPQQLIAEIYYNDKYGDYLDSVSEGTIGVGYSSSGSNATAILHLIPSLEDDAVQNGILGHFILWTGGEYHIHFVTDLVDISDASLVYYGNGLDAEPTSYDFEQAYGDATQGYVYRANVTSPDIQCSHAYFSFVSAEHGNLRYPEETNLIISYADSDCPINEGEVYWDPQCRAQLTEEDCDATGACSWTDSLCLYQSIDDVFEQDDVGPYTGGTDPVAENSTCVTSFGQYAFENHTINCRLANDFNNTLSSITVSLQMLCSGEVWVDSATSDAGGLFNAEIYVPGTGECTMIVSFDGTPLVIETASFTYSGCDQDCHSENGWGTCSSGTCVCHSCWDGAACAVRKCTSTCGCEVVDEGASIEAGRYTSVGELALTGGASEASVVTMTLSSSPTCSGSAFEYRTDLTDSTHDIYVFATCVGDYTGLLSVSGTEVDEISWSVKSAPADTTSVIITCPSSSVEAGTEAYIQGTFEDEYGNPTTDFEQSDYTIRYVLSSETVSIDEEHVYVEDGALIFESVPTTAGVYQAIVTSNGVDRDTCQFQVVASTVALTNSDLELTTTCLTAGRACAVSGYVKDQYGNPVTTTLYMELSCSTDTRPTSIACTSGLISTSFVVPQPGSCTITIETSDEIQLFSYSKQFTGYLILSPTEFEVSDDGETDTEVLLVVLKSPIAAVTVPISSPDNAIISNPSSIIIPSNTAENTYYTLNVRGTRNTAVTGDADHTLVIGPIVSDDPYFSELELESIVTVKDVDSPTLDFDCSAETIPEAIGSWDCVLSISPEETTYQNATITISPSDRASTVSNVLVKSSTTVTLTIYDDYEHQSDDTELTITVSIPHPVDSSITVSNSFVLYLSDDDEPDLELTNENSFLQAGDTSTTTIVLKSQPKEDTDVYIFPLLDSATLMKVSPSLVQFSHDDWNVTKTFTVSARADKLISTLVQQTIKYSAYSTDTNFNSRYTELQYFLKPDNSDDYLSITTDGLVTEDTRTTTLAICLGAIPSKITELSISATYSELLSFDPASVTFSPDDRSICQLVNVEAVRDTHYYGDVVSVVTVACADSSVCEHSRTAEISITELDTVELVVSDIDGSPTEMGLAAEFTINLSSEPWSVVTMNVNSSNEAAGLVNISTIDIQPESYNTTIAISVTGQRDDLYDGDVAFYVNIELVSDDENYNGLSEQLSFSLEHYNWPVLESISQRAAPLVGGMQANLTGAHFLDGIEILVAGKRVNQTFQNETLIEFEFPEVDEVGNYALMAINSDGASATFADEIYFSDICAFEGYIAYNNECLPCPTGAECYGETIRPLAGYYLVDGTITVLECPWEDTCLGGSNVSSQCAEGHSGLMCATCLIGYYKTDDGCESCSGDHYELITAIVTAAVFFPTLFLLLAFGNRHVTDELIMTLLNLQFLTSGARDILQDAEGLFKTLFTILAAFSLEYQFVEEKCSTGSFSFNVYFYGELVIIGILAGLPLLIFKSMQWMYERRHIRSRAEEWRDRAFYATSVVLVTIYPNVVMLSLSALNCSDFDGTLRLDYDYNTICFSGSHWLTAFFAVVILLGYILGLPVVLVMIAVMRRRRPDNQKIHSLFDRLSTFYESFVVDKKWFIACFFALDFTLSTIYVFFRSNEQVQFTFSLTAVLFFLIFTAFGMPFENRAELYLTVLATVGALLAVTVHFLSWLLPQGNFAIVFFDFIVAILIVLILCLGVIALVRATLEARKNPSIDPGTSSYRQMTPLSGTPKRESVGSLPSFGGSPPTMSARKLAPEEMLAESQSVNGTDDDDEIGSTSDEEAMQSHFVEVPMTRFNSTALPEVEEATL